MLCHSAQTSVCPKSATRANGNHHQLQSAHTSPCNRPECHEYRGGYAASGCATLLRFSQRLIGSCCRKNCGSASKCGAPLYLPLRAALVFMPLSTDTPPRVEAP